MQNISLRLANDLPQQVRNLACLAFEIGFSTHGMLTLVAYRCT
jgi:hypothetical protein